MSILGSFGAETQTFSLGLEFGMAINAGLERSILQEEEGEDDDDILSKALSNVLFLTTVAIWH